MRLAHAFYKFPFVFDVERLRHELDAIPEEVWCKHPQDYTGNAGLPLVATEGKVNDDFAPPMRPTEFLERSPYIQQIFAKFETLIGRARLMRLEPGCGVPPHVDIQYYWRMHTRVHIPVVTDPEVQFLCGGGAVHMAAGEAWTFDNWRPHQVINGPDTRRVHLTFDTYGSARFWELAKPLGTEDAPTLIPFRDGAAPELEFETYAGGPVMSPGDLDLEFSQIISDCVGNSANDMGVIRSLFEELVKVRNDWRVVWNLTGPAEHGHQRFAAIIDRALAVCSAVPKELTLSSNGVPAASALNSTVYAMMDPVALGKVKHKAMAVPAATVTVQTRTEPRFDRPVFIVAAPRSGSTWLYEMLAENESFWSLGGEAHDQIEAIPALNPRSRGFHSNRLTAEDATPDVRRALIENFSAKLRDARGRTYRQFDGAPPESVRFLEKTPRNALRIPFFKTMFPDARFIFLHRDPRANIGSIIDAWQSGRFATYRDLPGWSGLPWSLLLIPGWQELIGKAPEQVAMRQWHDTNEAILADLGRIPQSDWCAVDYDDIVGDPAGAIQRLCDFADVPFSPRMREVAQNASRPSRYALTAPAPEKWRKHEAPILSVAAETRATWEKLRALHSGRKSRAAE